MALTVTAETRLAPVGEATLLATTGLLTLSGVAPALTASANTITDVVDLTIAARAPSVAGGGTTGWGASWGASWGG